MASAARAPGAAVLPPLREEIGISRGPAALDGSPTWTLHDPAVNRFYRLGWPEFEIVSRWDSQDADELVARVNAETTLRIEPDDIEQMVRFLRSYDLFARRHPADDRLPGRQAQRTRQSVGNGCCTTICSCAFRWCGRTVS